MFEGWGNYFAVLGEAAATLIGVMALVATLTSGSGNPARAERGQRLFLTPTVFHMASVLTVSALTLAPRQSAAVHLLLMAGALAWGLGYALVVAVQLARARREASAHWSDFWCYGALPPWPYAAMLAALALARVQREAACAALALSLLALLLVAMRNAWDLVTWLAPRRQTLNASDPPIEPTIGAMTGAQAAD